MAEISGPDPANLPARAFLHGLRDLGWIDGRTVIIERRTAAESRRASAYEGAVLLPRPAGRPTGPTAGPMSLCTGGPPTISRPVPPPVW